MSAPDVYTETLAEFIARLGITATVKPSTNAGPAGMWPADARHFSVTLKSAELGGRLTVPFHQGSAHTVDPTAAEVLECLLSDASMVENDDMDGLELKPSQVVALVRQTQDLAEFLGGEYEHALWGLDT